MKSLLLTLGHGSSAILLEDGRVLNGYENERLTGIKSDSQFPSAAIEEIECFDNIPDNIAIYVSHWFTDPDTISETNKWWNRLYLERKYPSHIIYALNHEFTHHDAHAYSAISFSGIKADSHTIVCDGFGTYGETLSVYEQSEHSLKLIHRCFGFENSVGLFYQYATSYLGLKMNQDEYKLLGYESTRLAIFDDISVYAGKMVFNILSTTNSKYDPMVSIDALPAIAKSHYETFDALCFKHNASTETEKKILISTFVQGVVEMVLIALVSHFKIHDVTLVGGVFMNVKLNSAISRYVSGKTTIMPLCGDSGAAIGLYNKINKVFEWPNNLFWGRRDLSPFQSDISNGITTAPKQCAAEIIRDHLQSGMIVNLVQGNMEFGPRALGNTSTLALPTIENVQYINSCNNRSTIMPMAGVCRDVDVHKFHNDVDKINKSMEYMICTRDFICDQNDIRGAAHFDTNRGVHTGRTQVLVKDEDSVLYNVLTDKMPLIINTSFNPHGLPIPCTDGQIFYAHMYMKNRDPQNRIITIIIKE